MHRYLIVLLVACFFIGCSRSGNQETVGIFFDGMVPQIEFVADDIKTSLESKGFKVEPMSTLSLTNDYPGKSIVLLLASDTELIKSLRDAGGAKEKLSYLGAQAFSIQTTNKNQQTYWVIGGDVAGVMYGGLQLAENISFEGLHRN